MNLDFEVQSSAMRRAAKRRVLEEQALQEVRSQATVKIVTAGLACGVGPQASYRAVETGDIPTIRIGNEMRVPTAPLRKMLGLEEAA